MHIYACSPSLVIKNTLLWNQHYILSLKKQAQSDKDNATFWKYIQNEGTDEQYAFLDFADISKEAAIGGSGTGAFLWILRNF